jgi:hypothetical protein
VTCASHRTPGAGALECVRHAASIIVVNHYVPGDIGVVKVIEYFCYDEAAVTIYVGEPGVRVKVQG